MIIGLCEIGENSEIAARAFITRDVDSNMRVYTKAERVDVSIIQE